MLEREPLTSGLVEACRELNVALVAHSPLQQGLLTGAGWLQQHGAARALPSGASALQHALAASRCICSCCLPGDHVLQAGE